MRFFENGASKNTISDKLVAPARFHWRVPWESHFQHAHRSSYWGRHLESMREWLCWNVRMCNLPQRHFSPAEPDASRTVVGYTWAEMDRIQLNEVFLHRVPMLKNCPQFLRGRLREFLQVALRERFRAKLSGVRPALGSCLRWCQ